LLEGVLRLGRSALKLRFALTLVTFGCAVSLCTLGWRPAYSAASRQMILLAAPTSLLLSIPSDN